MTQTTVDAPSKDRAQIPARTLRKDRYWLSPLVTFVVFAAWVIYATVRSMMGNYYWVDKYHYLTPFYSPCVSDACKPGSADLGTFIPAHLPFFIPYALISLPFLLGFRLTCYYYRKAYYRAFWLTPSACAVPDKSPARKTPGKYTGETRLPLILQNVHRYFWVIAGLISIVNTWDAINAFHGKDGGFGIGLHPVLPLVPPRHGRTAQDLLQGPHPLLDVDAGQQAQHPPWAVRADHARHARADRRVRRAPRPRGLLRPADLQLRTTSRD
jgi:hypothetical protein